jgi:pyruvate-formate lyase-activating enzyme
MEDFQRSESGYVPLNEHNLSLISERLGKSLCLAKFSQVTINLASGKMHSCHHPVQHKIPLSELENNPAALFNTSYLKEKRKQMLSGIRPSECDYCWRVEDNTKQKSDRHNKSLEPWALPRYDAIINSTGEEDFTPTYLEVSFSNACNFSCLYCGPEFSSRWVKDLKEKGSIHLFEGTSHSFKQQGHQDLDNLIIKNRDINPYIDAFWKWFPEIYKDLKTYRITGGEPLMSKETFRSIDWFLENPNLDLEFCINTNLGVTDELWNKFFNKISQLADEKKVKKVVIYTSVEGWGERAEYVRRGLDFNKLKSRIEQILQHGNIRCVIMAAYNVLSITSYGDLLSWVLSLKQKYNIVGDSRNTIAHIYKESGFGQQYEPVLENKISIDTPYVRSPKHLDAQYCTDDLVNQYLLPSLAKMIDNTTKHVTSFQEFELAKLKRITHNRCNFKHYGEDDNRKDIIQQRATFYEYINNIDNRYSTNFLKTFPEMEKFYRTCEIAWEKFNDN